MGSRQIKRICHQQVTTSLAQFQTQFRGQNQIQSLDFSCNSFSGDIAVSLTKLTNLVSLNLSLNGFENKVSKYFELPPRLEILELHGNTLSGHLDEEFLRFSSTIHVDLSGSILVNSSCRNFSYLFISSTVMHLNISHNQLMGSLERRRLDME